MPDDAPSPDTLAARWLDAAADPAIAAELEAVYADTADRITERAPVCWASGRCCNFEKTGHRLYTTGLEAAYTLINLRHDPLTLADIDTARARGGCPFQQRNLCTVHTIKPLACRTYFCDRSAQDWQQMLTERAGERIRRLHDEHDIPYRYAEWRDTLASLVRVLGTSGGGGSGVSAD